MTEKKTYEELEAELIIANAQVEALTRVLSRMEPPVDRMTAEDHRLQMGVVGDDLTTANWVAEELRARANNVRELVKTWGLSEVVLPTTWKMQILDALDTEALDFEAAQTSRVHDEDLKAYSAHGISEPEPAAHKTHND